MPAVHLVREPKLGHVANIDPNDPLPPTCSDANCQGDRPAVRVRCDINPGSGRRMMFYACRSHAWALEDDAWHRNVVHVAGDGEANQR